MRIGRRAFGLGVGATLLSACQGAAQPAALSPVAKAEGKPDAWTPILPNSDLAAGPNRFLFAVLDERNRPILDAQVHLRFFDRIDQPTEPKSEADAVFRGQGLGAKGVYVARVEFPTAGTWGVEATVRRGDGATRALRSRLEVKAQSATPAVGAPPPPSRQGLMAGAANPDVICTAKPHCAFHDITVADALALKKPAALLFATPAFCTSATCGPDLETLQSIEPDFRGRVTFVHLEIYSDPQTQTPTPTVTEWKLPSEPWLFLIDRDGKVRDKLEGGLTAPEIREGIERLV
jgi:hypothetical protein